VVVRGLLLREEHALPDITGRVGSEIEHFIFDEDGRAPGVDALRAFAAALSEQGFAVSQRAHEGKEVAASWSDAAGEVVLHNDFCTHVFEISLPPGRSAAELRRVHGETYERVEAALGRSGLSILDVSFLERLPEALCFVEGASVAGTQRYQWFQNLKPPAKEYALPLFNARLASIHIHVETSLQRMTPRLAALYEDEFLVPILFANGSTSGPGGVHCMRPLVWRDAFEDAYWASAIPRDIPESWERYADRLQGSAAVIPRDFSFICPRPEYGTLEFRSTCTHVGWEKLAAMIGFRLLCLQRAASGRQAQPLAQSREMFYEVCQHGSAAVSEDVVAERLRELEQYGGDVPAEWAETVASLGRLVASREASGQRAVELIDEDSAAALQAMEPRPA
jgi:hypothetical protein